MDLGSGCHVVSDNGPRLRPNAFASVDLAIGVSRLQWWRTPQSSVCGILSGCFSIMRSNSAHSRNPAFYAIETMERLAGAESRGRTMGPMHD